VSSLQLRRADDRERTRTAWLDSAHSFSFGAAYDPDNLHFGLLLVSNEDVVAAGAGFDTHPHRDMEIVTWVISGALVHQDSQGNNGLIYPGLAQRMTAGTGILHSEKNDGSVPAHFVQMWVSPDEVGVPPGYEQLEVAEWLASGELVPVASGLARHRGDTGIRISQRDAGLSVARLVDGGRVKLPSAPYLHVFVAHGTLTLAGVDRPALEVPAQEVLERSVLQAGDALRITDGGGVSLRAIGSAEVLVWEMHSKLK
jgi:redox-sensitive bicupin YhaK (pirin superfamily)